MSYRSIDGSPTNTSASGFLRVPLTTGPTRHGAGARQQVTRAALDGDGVLVVIQRLGNSSPDRIGVSRRRTRYYCKKEEKIFERLKVQCLICELNTLLINTLVKVYNKSTLVFILLKRFSFTRPIKSFYTLSTQFYSDDYWHCSFYILCKHALNCEVTNSVV